MKILKVLLPIVGFAIFALYVLLGQNSEVLYTMHDRGTFFYGCQFFTECMQTPAGLLRYAGSALTQMFYEPWIGASALVLIWVLTYFVGIKSLRLSSTCSSVMLLPLGCLLAAPLAIGYWIYLMPLNGYCFVPSLALLLVLLMYWAASRTPERFHIVWFVLALCLYPPLGWASQLFALSLFLHDLTSRIKTKHKILSAVGIVVVLAAPWIWYPILYNEIQMTEILKGGFPLFVTSTSASIRPTVPLFVAVALILLFVTCHRVNLSERGLLKKRGVIASITISMLMLAASAGMVWKYMYQDDNYISEMRMNRALMEDDWNAVISEAEKTIEPSRAMVVMKNIALMNTGQIGSRAFELGCSGKEIYNPDSLNVDVMYIASPVIFYHYGFLNYSIRWGLEGCIASGFSPYKLKIMARAAKASGEKGLERKYVSLLHKIPFYSDWQTPETGDAVKRLSKAFSDELANDHNNCERFLIQTLSNGFASPDPLVVENSLLYSMLYRSTSCINALINYVKQHPDKPLPKHYQEAYLIFIDAYKQKLPISQTVDPEIQQNFNNFKNQVNELISLGYDEQGVGEATRADWCYTYWWYSSFGRNMY